MYRDHRHEAGDDGESVTKQGALAGNDTLSCHLLRLRLPGLDPGIGAGDPDEIIADAKRWIRPNRWPYCAFFKT